MYFCALRDPGGRRLSLSGEEKRYHSGILLDQEAGAGEGRTVSSESMPVTANGDTTRTEKKVSGITLLMGRKNVARYSLRSRF